MKNITSCFCTHSGRVYASNDGVPVFTLTNRVVIDTEFLSNEMHSPPLFGTQSPRERKLIAHVIILEQQDARVDVQCRGIVQIELIARGFDGGAIHTHGGHEVMKLLYVGVNE